MMAKTIDCPYFADLDTNGTACIFEWLTETHTARRLIWRLVGHTTLNVAQFTAAEMNRTLHSEV